MANYEVLRGQILGTQTGIDGHMGWAVLVRQGLAAWLSTIVSVQRTSIPASNTTREGILPSLQSEVANILTTMVWSHYLQKPL